MRPVRKPVQPTVPSVAAMLKREGLTRSVATSTRVRGYKSISTGFKVQKPSVGGAFALVSYTYALGDNTGSMEQMMLRITELLEQCDFRVERTSWLGDPMENGPYLSVYEKEDFDVQA